MLVFLLAGAGLFAANAQPASPTPESPVPNAVETVSVQPVASPGQAGSPPAIATADQTLDPFEDQLTPELEAKARELLRQTLALGQAPEPQVPKPQAPQPQAPEPQAPEPQAPEPQAPEPQIAEPQAPEPQIAEPQAPEPQVAEPQVAEPEVAKPQVAEPEVAEPEVAEPEVAELQAPTVQNKDASMNADQEALARQILQVEVGKPHAATPVAGTASAAPEAAHRTFGDALKRDFLGRRGRDMFDVGP
ncbi:MAG: hypothetical protein JXQ71_16450 [Verrucomicrobia bacterium]|nr:hypothetical protein [Verrucomicrobiota bacterium]